MKHLWTLNRYFIKYKWHLILGILCVVASNYFKLFIPRAVREAIDLVVANLSFHELIRDVPSAALWEGNISRSLLFYGLMVFGASLTTGIFMFFMRQTVIVMSRRIEGDMRGELFHHYNTLDQGFIRRNKTGDLMSRISEDVSKVRMYLGPGLLYSINLVSLFVMVIYTMIQVNMTLTLYTLIPLPILSISIYYVSHVINQQSAIIQRQIARLTSISQEVFSGIRVIKSYSQEEALGSYFSEESGDYRAKSLKLAQVNAYFFPLMVLMIGASTIITIYVGGLLAIKGVVSAGNIAEFVIYVNMLTWPVTAIGWIASIVQQAEASQERINSMLDYKSPIYFDQGARRSALAGSILFDHVSFTYEDSGLEVLQDFNLSLQAGKSLAIVGKTASGKTTIADLIFRLFDTDKGQVKVDGVNVKSWDLQHLRSQMAFVPQDMFLFSNTVAENIKLGNPEATMEEVITYAKLACVHDDILGLKDGYETIVGERGVTLSGGQKQRLTLARALMQKPKILVMDDCLSAVDAATENEIINNLSSIMKKKTTIFITHRLQALALFDRIIVLENGQIVEEGKHDNLLILDGVYSGLFNQQSFSLDPNGIAES